jgi:hypothetical protein
MGSRSDIVTLFNFFIWPVINIILVIWYVRRKK